MKILAELVSVNQKWLPDTGELINVVVFSYAGVVAEVVVSEQQAASVVRQSQAEPRHRLTQPLRPQEPVQPQEEREFGGDLEEAPAELAKAPPTFQDPPEFQEPPSAPVTPREKMRKRAELPLRAQDPDGFPQG